MSRKPRERRATEGREGALELPERWSAGQKTEVVLRLLRGEDLGELSRELQVAPPELEEWRRVAGHYANRRPVVSACSATNGGGGIGSLRSLVSAVNGRLPVSASAPRREPTSRSSSKIAVDSNGQTPTA
jgi:hypothetical protein